MYEYIKALDTWYHSKYIYSVTEFTVRGAFAFSEVQAPHLSSLIIMLS